MGEAVGGNVEARGPVEAPGSDAARGARADRDSARLGPGELRRWAYACVDGLTDRCDEINELNVFPIPDSDTGTNLVFTVRAAVESMRAAGPDADLPAVAAALAYGATAGARGNSGVIVSQFLRAFAEQSTGGEIDGRALQRVLGRAAELILSVISVPMQGTIVTVMHEAASAAASPRDDDLRAVVARSADAAAEALERTRTQLPVLDVAGVVDAGALGLSIMLDALCHVVTGVETSRPRYHRPVVAPHAVGSIVRSGRGTDTAHAVGRPVVGYEVVYRITDIDDVVAARIRRSLSDLGESVVVAGDGARTWSAHVHTTNPGAAVEAGIRAGRIADVRIDAFVPDDHGASEFRAATPRTSGRDILAVVAGAAAENLYRNEGAVVLRCDTATVGTSELCAAIVASVHHEVLVLPNGALSAHELVSVSIASRTAGKDVLMLPSSSMVQGLAALAVHDPTREAVDDAFAMSEAAAGTRWASVRAAEERSLTWVGMCRPGDGLGLIGREVVVIGSDVFAAGCDLLDQLLSVGGEMVTMLRGERIGHHFDGEEEPDVTERLAAHVSERYPGVEVVVYDGGQPGDVVQLGVE